MNEKIRNLAYMILFENKGSVLSQREIMNQVRERIGKTNLEWEGIRGMTFCELEKLERKGVITPEYGLKMRKDGEMHQVKLGYFIP